MPFIESANEFHARHGGRCVEVQGFLYYRDGATAEKSAYGFRAEPPSDPFARAKIVAAYWRASAAIAAEEFGRAKQEAVWAVRGAANGGYSPPTEGYAAVTKARDDARHHQAELARPRRSWRG